MFELRASLNLARLWRGNGKMAEARELISSWPVRGLRRRCSQNESHVSCTPDVTWPQFAHLVECVCEVDG